MSEDNEYVGPTHACAGPGCPGEEHKIDRDNPEKEVVPTEFSQGFKRYQHIERMGHQLVEGLLDGPAVVVQDKMDGANLSVTMDGVELTVLIASRNQLIFDGKNILNPFNGAVDYIMDHPGIRKFLREYPHLILRGEWLVKHSIMYDAQHFHHFYVFDVENKMTGAYLSPEDYEQILNEFGIKMIPSLVVIEPTMEKLAELSQGTDPWGAKQKEGIVIKRYDFRNRYGVPTWGKIVSADFNEANKLAFGAGRKDDPELRFVANHLTPSLVQKIIDKIRDEKGEVSVRDMTRVLHQTWYDLFHEELWDFTKKARTKEFNLQAARRLAEGKTRQIALAIFNGIRSASDYLPPLEPGTGAGEAVEGSGIGMGA